MSGRFIVPLMALLAGCATQAPKQQGAQQNQAQDPSFGVLVMAHGGGEQWNKDVIAAVAPLKAEYNVEVAFGMADAASLQKSVQQLEGRGARHIGVVRLFISGESFKERTEQILGMIPGAPAKPAVADEHAGHANHGQGHGGHSMEFWRVDTRASFVISEQGLVEAPEMGEVLATRAKTLSKSPAQEDVLILAHGPGDDAENERWLKHLDARADVVRKASAFHAVRVETLREDWPEKRVDAEKRIRAFVEQASHAGRRVLVIPFRVQGFGPYAKVLEGLPYVSDGQGLIPHPSVTEWIEHQIETLRPVAQRAAR
jgi:sirohydrochlorin cobaltochelatase